MKALRTLLLFLAVLGLGAYIYWVDAERLSTPEREAAQRRAFSLDVDRLEVLGIRRPEYALTLRRAGEAWRVEGPQEVPASQATVRQMLSRLRNLSRGELITPADMRERGQTLADFGLAVPVAVLTLEDARGERVYRIGNPNPLGNALYVKEEQSQNVMLISSDLMEILPVRADAFRDRRLLTGAVNTVSGLSFLAPGRLVRLERQAEQWLLTEPFRFPAQAERVETVLAQLEAARVERFLLREEMGDAPFGAEEDLVVLRIHFSGGQPPVELEIGNRLPGSPQERFARFAGQDGVFVVSEGVRALALTELMALQELRILPVEAGRIRGMTLRAAGSEDGVVLERGDGGWMLREPLGVEASGAAAEGLAAAWTAARVEERHPLSQAKDLLYTLEVALAPESGAIPASYAVYTDERNPAAVWVRPQGMEELWRIFPDALVRAPLEPLAYESRAVFGLNPAEVIRVHRLGPGGEVTLIRAAEGEAWTVEAGDGVADAANVERFLQAFSEVEAERLLTRDPSRHAEWGLETAPVRLTFGLGGEKPGSRTLWISPGEDGGLAGRIQGQDLVFTLPDAFRELLTLPLTRPAPVEAETDATGGADA